MVLKKVGNSKRPGSSPATGKVFKLVVKPRLVCVSKRMGDTRSLKFVKIC